jgi:hypothetical protein
MPEPFAGFEILGIYQMHSAHFRSPYATISPRNHFTLKKMGVSDAMESTILDAKPNRKLLDIIRL